MSSGVAPPLDALAVTSCQLRYPAATLSSPREARRFHPALRHLCTKIMELTNDVPAPRLRPLHSTA